MKLIFHPQFSQDELAINVSGDIVTINGVMYDLTPLIDGGHVFTGRFSAKRLDGEIVVQLPLPYSSGSEIDPGQIIEVDADGGPVAVPGHDAQQPAAIVPGVIDWPEPQPELTEAEKREARYRRRAAVRDELLAWLAADNEGRIVSGEWTLADYDGMLADPHISKAMAYMQMAAYELVAQYVAASEHPLMTPAIKAAWTTKLAEHFYNEVA